MASNMTSETKGLAVRSGETMLSRSFQEQAEEPGLKSH